MHRRLRHSATDGGTPGFDREYGDGVVNPVGALAAEVPQRVYPDQAGSSESAVASRRDNRQQDTSSTGNKVLFAIIGFVVILAPPVLITVLIVRLIRRSRRRRRAREAVPVGGRPEEIR